MRMPAGIPVAVVESNGGLNAGILAARIIASADPVLRDHLYAYRASLRDDTLARADRLERLGPAAYSDSGTIPALQSSATDSTGDIAASALNPRSKSEWLSLENKRPSSEPTSSITVHKSENTDLPSQMDNTDQSSVSAPDDQEEWLFAEDRLSADDMADLDTILQPAGTYPEAPNTISPEPADQYTGDTTYLEDLMVGSASSDEEGELDSLLFDEPLLAEDDPADFSNPMPAVNPTSQAIAELEAPFAAPIPERLDQEHSLARKAANLRADWAGLKGSPGRKS